ncbi:hypothetical protein Dimus_031927, partial [Dionaea muscipula]
PVASELNPRRQRHNSLAKGTRGRGALGRNWDTAGELDGRQGNTKSSHGLLRGFVEFWKVIGTGEHRWPFFLSRGS